MMPAKVEHLLDELTLAFPAARADPFAALVNSTHGDEPVWVEEAFRDKTDWTELDADWLDQVPNGLSSALSFLSNEAVCYYIPAFIAADLKGRLGNADPAFTLTSGFAQGVGDQRIHPREPRTWGDYARERWAGLTSAQAQAVVHYLEWRIERDQPLMAHPIIEALQNYWYERAGGAAPPTGC
jgi:hypothetical protein